MRQKRFVGILNKDFKVGNINLILWVLQGVTIHLLQFPLELELLNGNRWQVKLL